MSAIATELRTDAAKLRTTAEERQLYRERSSQGTAFFDVLDDVDTLLTENARLKAGSEITEERVEWAFDAGIKHVREGDEGVWTVEAMRAALEAASPLAPRQAPERFDARAYERLRGALERIDAATPGNTNSRTADDMRSWCKAVAACALHDAAAMLAAPGEAGGAWRPIANAPLDKKIRVGRWWFGVFYSCEVTYLTDDDEPVRVPGLPGNIGPNVWCELMPPPPVSDGE